MAAKAGSGVPTLAAISLDIGKDASTSSASSCRQREREHH